MQGLDLVILIFTAFLLVKGIWKGFVKEIAGILAVVLAVAVSFSFHKDTAGYLVSFIGEKYAAIAAYLALFLAVYLVVMLLGNVLDRVLKSIFLGGFNRVLGGVFWPLKVGAMADLGHICLLLYKRWNWTRTSGVDYRLPFLSFSSGPH